MPSRPRVLFLSQCLPFPPHSGVTNRIYNLLRVVSEYCDISLCAYFRRNHQATTFDVERAVRALQDMVYAVEVVSEIPAEASITRRLFAHSRSVVSGEPYTCYEYSAPAFDAAIHRLLADRDYDLLHLDSLDLYRYGRIAKQQGLPVTCTHHSLESDLLLLRASVMRNPLLKAYVRHQAGLVRRTERTTCRVFSRNITMSELDEMRLQRLAPGVRTAVIPNGVDVEYFSPQPRGTTEHQILFVGPSYMLPNYDAVIYFLRRIWGRVREEVPNAVFVIAGKCEAKHRRRFETFENVRVLGYVEDLRQTIADSTCTVVPLRVGGGTRLKILDSWSMERAVVSTSIGCEGLAVEDGVNVIIRDDPSAFAFAIVELIRDARARRKIEKAGRETAVLKYSWEEIGRRQAKVFQDISMQAVEVRDISEGGVVLR